MNDVMLDFEALGTGKDKCLCQVGAIYFNRSTGELGESLQININAESHEKHGGKLLASTVYWWLSQSKEAQESFLSNRIDIVDAMTQLNTFLSKAKRIWSHATFDFVVLMDTLQQLNIKPNMSYKSAMDIRTLVDLSGITMSDIPREGVHHDALDDCKHQVKYCVAAINAIKINKQVISFIEKVTKIG